MVHIETMCEWAETRICVGESGILYYSCLVTRSMNIKLVIVMCLSKMLQNNEHFMWNIHNLLILH
jgi:hypothetical protein